MSVWKYRPADFSDAGNADAFAEWTENGLLHCDAIGWLRWSGTHWEQSDHGAVDFAKQYSAEMLKDAICEYAEAVKATISIKDETVAKKYLAHAQKCRSRNSISAMIELSKPTLHADLSEFDANGYRLNTPGGVVDLNTGQTIPHAPGCMCTKITKVAPSKVNGKLWQIFLDEITSGDAKLAEFLQQVAGMVATGVIRTETAIILFGAGRNGKSTFLNCLYDVLGSYAGSLNIDVLTTSAQNKGPAFASLQGLRLAVGGELEQGARLSASALKQICSTDKILGERKYCAPESFVPSHSLVLSTNYRFRIGNLDTGTWRRILLVPFTADFTGIKERKNYGNELVEKAGGVILQWMIDGAVMFNRCGGKLTIPDAVAEATEAYQEVEDWLQSFLDDCCITGGNSRTTSQTLYNAYRDYANSSGEYTRRAAEFSEGLAAKGYRKLNVHGVMQWVGIALKSSGVPAGYYSRMNG